MDRDRESIRDEALQLDEESQAWLAEEIEENLAKSAIRSSWIEEAQRRLEEHRRGEGSTVSTEEMFANGRKMIEDAKRTRA